MRKNLAVKPLALVILMSIHAVSQAAEITSGWAISPMLSYIKTDDDRRAEDDIGVALVLGKSINKNWDIELNFVSDKLTFNSGFMDFEQRGLMLDGVYFFDRQNSLQTYAVLGGGVMDTTVGGVNNSNNLFNAGIGVMRKITDYGIALRFDIRYRRELDNNTVPFESAFDDLILNIGIHIPFGKKTVSPVLVILPVDTDNDGVLDVSDDCAATAVGVKVDQQGCEVKQDNDKDGVLNSQDRCPDSAAGLSVDIHGCELQSFILEGVNFELGSAVLTAGAREALLEVAATLKKNPTHEVEVAGYTDGRGQADINQRLSQQRAVAVKVYLESIGVMAKQMSARGYGAADPIAENSTAAGRTQNRRVELHILN